MVEIWTFVNEVKNKISFTYHFVWLNDWGVFVLYSVLMFVTIRVNFCYEKFGIG